MQEVLKPESVLLKNSSATLQLEGLKTETTVLAGDVPDTVELRENGLSYRCLLYTSPSPRDS